LAHRFFPVDGTELAVEVGEHTEGGELAALDREPGGEREREVRGPQITLFITERARASSRRLARAADLGTKAVIPVTSQRYEKRNVQGEAAGRKETAQFGRSRHATKDLANRN
ncbi:hypothetical protein XENOCAPTIV_012002, partial [Xenoophorus captivus]